MTGNTNAASNTMQYANTKKFTGKYWTDGRPIYSIVCSGSNVSANGWAVIPWVDVTSLKIDLVLSCFAMGKDTSATYPKLFASFNCAITSSNTFAIMTSPMNCTINEITLEYVETV